MSVIMMGVHKQHPALGFQSFLLADCQRFDEDRIPRIMARNSTPYDRRTVLRTVGAVAFASGLAGCTGSQSEGSDYETIPQEGKPDYGGWLDNANGYDGTADFRGESEVSVAVGADNRGLAFEPAAIMIDPATTVVWEWTGMGGGHNVVEENEAFGDDEIVMEESHTYEYTFESATVYRYFCTPHRAQGMRGAVAVEG